MNLLNTPILFLVFNREDTTKKVFSEIRKAKPKKLFISSDGPRKNNSLEKKTVERIRKYILKNIDWKCEVKTLFRQKNLGCKYAVAGAIDWFFKNVEQGIILEDDCLPSQSFFKFCQEMLTKYQKNEKIMMISGDNFIEQITKDMPESYYFSRHAHIWGWATWKRAWKKYDVEMYKKVNDKYLKTISSGFLEYFQNKKRWGELSSNRCNTWDYQWDFILKFNRGIVIIPKKNLVENIGLLQNQFTNTRPTYAEIKYLHKARNELTFPLKHPLGKITPNKKLDFQDTLLYLKKAILKRLFEYFRPHS